MILGRIEDELGKDMREKTTMLTEHPQFLLQTDYQQLPQWIFPLE